MTRDESDPTSETRGVPSAPDFRTLFESAPGLYLVLLPDFGIVAVTDAYLAATMTRRDQIIGRSLFEVFPDNPSDPDATGVANLRTSLDRVVRTGVADAMAVQKYDIQRPASQGGGFEERYWSPVNLPVLGPDGALQYIIHRVEDVSEFIRLKNADAHQAKVAEELKSRTQQMEVEIFRRAQQVQEANQKLQRANDELAALYQQTKEIDRLKTEFFSNVSHEFRTPLTLILNPVRTLLGTSDLSIPQRQHLTMVERSASLLLHYVTDLLDLSRIDAGAMQIRYASIDLAKLVRTTASHFGSLAASHQIQYRVHVPEPLIVQADASKLERVILNLIANAFKFTPAEGSVTITLRADEGRVRLTVGDSGPGVPPDLRQAIFERYRQGNGMSGTRSGTGLGLSIVRELVMLHRGKVHVESADDGGAAFVVELPMHAPAGTVVALTAPEPAAELATHLIRELLPRPESETAVDSSLPPKTPLVLIVEDNPDLRDMLVSVLSKEFRTWTAADGLEGVERAQVLRPDLILSDIMMPRMSGDQMLRVIRSHANLASIPFVFLTAKADEEFRLRILEEGVQEFISKPFSAREVMARVRRLIAERRSEQERFRLIVESAPQAIILTDHTGRVILMNSMTETLFGYPRRDLIGMSAELLTVRPGRPGAPPLQAWRQGREESDKIIGVRRDGTTFPIEVSFSNVTAAEGPLLLAAVTDITERARAERRQSLMVAELDHRVKNILSVVEAVAIRTLGATSIGADATENFFGRLRALGRMHEALANNQWEGADLRELVLQTLQSHLDHSSDRVQVERPHLMIPGPQGQTLSLALHELATNAAKYGALSTPSGRLRVGWAIHESTEGVAPRLVLTWEESGGPPVATPRHFGFGSSLIVDGLAHDLNAKTSLEFLPEGVRCRVDAPFPC